MATNSFRLHYLAKAAAGVPRDLVNTFINSKLHPLRPDSSDLQLHLGL